MNRQPSLLRRLIRRSWQIALLTLVASIALVSLIFVLVRPTYEAFSLLRVEPQAPNLFVPAGVRDDGASFQHIQTQVQLIKSDSVIASAVANPLISNLTSIKQTEDPKGDLRRELSVEIIPNTYLIRVALQSKNPTEAAVIVNAVVESYRAHSEQYAQSVNRRLRETLELERESLGKKFAMVQVELEQLVRQRVADAAKEPLNEANLKYRMLSHELDSLQARLDQVTNSLQQLNFESNQASFRIVLVDPASVPITPFNNVRFKMMAAAPGVAFLVISGLVLLFEIIAGRLAREAEASSARLRAESRDLLEGDYFPFKR